MIAFLGLHDLAIRWPSEEEKEDAKAHTIQQCFAILKLTSAAALFLMKMNGYGPIWHMRSIVGALPHTENHSQLWPRTRFLIITFPGCVFCLFTQRCHPQPVD